MPSAKLSVPISKDLKLAFFDARSFVKDCFCSSFFIFFFLVAALHFFILLSTALPVCLLLNLQTGLCKPYLIASYKHTLMLTSGAMRMLGKALEKHSVFAKSPFMIALLRFHQNLLFLSASSQEKFLRGLIIFLRLNRTQIFGKILKLSQSISHSAFLNISTKNLTQSKYVMWLFLGNLKYRLKQIAGLIYVLPISPSTISKIAFKWVHVFSLQEPRVRWFSARAIRLLSTILLEIIVSTLLLSLWALTFSQAEFMQQYQLMLSAWFTQRGPYFTKVLNLLSKKCWSPKPKAWKCSQMLEKILLKLKKSLRILQKKLSILKTWQQFCQFFTTAISEEIWLRECVPDLLKSLGKMFQACLNCHVVLLSVFRSLLAEILMLVKALMQENLMYLKSINPSNFSVILGKINNILSSLCCALMAAIYKGWDDFQTSALLAVLKRCLMVSWITFSMLERNLRCFLLLSWITFSMFKRNLRCFLNCAINVAICLLHNFLHCVRLTSVIQQQLSGKVIRQEQAPAFSPESRKDLPDRKGFLAIFPKFPSCIDLPDKKVFSAIFFTFLLGTEAATTSSCESNGFLKNIEKTCRIQNDEKPCCVENISYKTFDCSPTSGYVLTLNDFSSGGDGGAAGECENSFYDNTEMVVAVSTGLYNKGLSCGKILHLSADKNRYIAAKIVDECDSARGCDKEHDYQPPCQPNVIDGSLAVWRSLGLDPSLGVVSILVDMRSLGTANTSSNFDNKPAEPILKPISEGTDKNKQDQMKIAIILLSCVIFILVILIILAEWFRRKREFALKKSYDQAHLNISHPNHPFKNASVREHYRTLDMSNESMEVRVRTPKSTVA